MRRLVIFVIETKSDKENSDGVYLRETLEHLYEYDRSNTIVKFVFMNGKGNYNKSSVVNKIDSYIKDSTSQSYGMSKIHVAINNAGAKIVVDEATGQNYAEWQADGATYKVWLEDEAALEAKLKLMKEYKLAGVASWRLGFETSSVWELILKYVN